MTVYLMQHGTPVSKDKDPERPLSDQGRKDVESSAEFLYKRGIRVQEVFHSGKRRALETAEIMSARLNPGTEPKAMEGLSPLDDVGEIADKINKEGGDLLIAGHLPCAQEQLAHRPCAHLFLRLCRLRPGLCAERHVLSEEAGKA